jgi:hypothetical protein
MKGHFAIIIVVDGAIIQGGKDAVLVGYYFKSC